MSRNLGGFAVSALHPGIFRTDHNAFEINQFARLVSYRSLGEGRDRRGLEERRECDRKKDNDALGIGIESSEIRGARLPRVPPCGAYPHPSTLGAESCAWGSPVPDSERLG